MKKNIIVVNVIFLALIFSVLLPGAKEIKPPWLFLCVIMAVEIGAMYRVTKGIKPKVATDISTIVLGFLLIWDVMTKHLDRTNPVLIPTPENVFYVFFSHGPMMLKGVFSSLELLLTGFTVSLVFGVALGLVIGWIPRLREMLSPVVRVLAPIPSVIYTPYIVALMPTFRSASAMVIILGLFFPTLLQMINRVHGMDRRIINSARSMGAGNGTMIFKVLLPFMIPGVISGLRVSLSTSIMILTLAEMMGATTGMGYFIKNYADFANYTNVIAGIILVGIVVTILNYVVTLLGTKIVKWS